MTEGAHLQFGDYIVIKPKDALPFASFLTGPSWATNAVSCGQVCQPLWPMGLGHRTYPFYPQIANIDYKPHVL